MTSLELRKEMCQRLISESEYMQIFSDMSAKESKKFWAYYDNPDIYSPETFITWLKKIGAL